MGRGDRRLRLRRRSMQFHVATLSSTIRLGQSQCGFGTGPLVACSRGPRIPSDSLDLLPRSRSASCCTCAWKHGKQQARMACRGVQVQGRRQQRRATEKKQHRLWGQQAPTSPRQRPRSDIEGRLLRRSDRRRGGALVLRPRAHSGRSARHELGEQRSTTAVRPNPKGGIASAATATHATVRGAC